MALFKPVQENRIRCGRCGTEFDFLLNRAGCPLCGFGSNKGGEQTLPSTNPKKTPDDVVEDDTRWEKVNVPTKAAKVIVDDETQTWGSWLMFNDLFAVKYLARSLAKQLSKRGEVELDVLSFITETLKNIDRRGLNSLKGFPNSIRQTDNLAKDSAVGRLVNHFLKTGVKMGLFTISSKVSSFEDIWKEDWSTIFVGLTQPGLEFARIPNQVFDHASTNQVLSDEESDWILKYLKKIDKDGYKEYTILKQVYDFLKAGNNGNYDLWDWFKSNTQFQEHIKRRSKGARENPKTYQRQLDNYSRSFSSAKISLLRELGLVKNRRNNYEILKVMP